MEKLDPMLNQEIHDAWHLYFIEKAVWNKREDWHLNRLYALQEGVNRSKEDGTRTTP